MKTLLFIFLLLIFLACLLLDKAYRTLPLMELRRRSRNNNHSHTSKIYRLAAYDDSLKVFIWLLGGLSSALLFITISDASGLLGILLFVIALGLIYANLPLSTNGTLWKIAANLSVWASKILDLGQPLFSRLSKALRSIKPVHMHTGLYEKEDLLELLNHQNQITDHRIPEKDLKIAFGALTYGDKKVGEVMTPRRAIKLVAATDTIGPLLMDELHASGISRFPVIKTASKESNPEIIGTLYLRDLVKHGEKGKVSEVMKKDVCYINESQTLREALAAFIKTQHHLLVVVNNFEEIAGVISLEDVVEQIVGEKIVDEFDRYDDMRAVASREAKQEQQEHHTVPEQPKQEQTKHSSSEVVE